MYDATSGDGSSAAVMADVTPPTRSLPTSLRTSGSSQKTLPIIFSVSILPRCSLYCLRKLMRPEPPMPTYRPSMSSGICEM